MMGNLFDTDPDDDPIPDIVLTHRHLNEAEKQSNGVAMREARKGTE